MATPHVASSQKANYSIVTRKEYEIAQVNGQRRLSEIPNIFDIVDFLSEEYGLTAYYRHDRTTESSYKGWVTTHRDTSIERFNNSVTQKVKGIVLYDSQPEKEGMYPAAPQKELFSCLPLLYMSEEDLLVLAVPFDPCLMSTRKQKFWHDLTDVIAEILEGKK